MFTGIVEEVGAVLARRDLDRGATEVEIGCVTVVAGTGVGDSIAVSGVCLTVTSLTAGGFTADLGDETLEVTSLGGLAPGTRVNLERPMAADGRFGGHVVQGHVDGVARVRQITPLRGTTLVTLDVPAPLRAYLVPKGSVTLDGVSLTVVDIDPTGCSVGLVPHTLDVTTLGALRAGDGVNLEVDILAKYVARMLQAGVARPDGGDS